MGLEEDLMQRLIEGRIDIAVMYTPQSRPGLKVDLLIEERLVLVSTSPAAEPKPGKGYVYIDWGPEFFAKHSASFPEYVSPGLMANVSWLGLQHILENGGSGYFPIRLVRSFLDNGRLHLVQNAPEFRHPAYVVYPAKGEDDLIDMAVAGMRRIAGREADMDAAGAERIRPEHRSS
jgi:DNA-binding transcriptional LysR family regulator